MEMVQEATKNEQYLGGTRVFLAMVSATPPYRRSDTTDEIAASG
jgi:hypothetical protein